MRGIPFDLTVGDMVIGNCLFMRGSNNGKRKRMDMWVHARAFSSSWDVA